MCRQTTRTDHGTTSEAKLKTILRSLHTRYGKMLRRLVQGLAEDPVLDATHLNLHMGQECGKSL